MGERRRPLYGRTDRPQKPAPRDLRVSAEIIAVITCQQRTSIAPPNARYPIPRQRRLQVVHGMQVVIEIQQRERCVAFYDRGAVRAEFGVTMLAERTQQREREARLREAKQILPPWQMCEDLDAR